MTKTVLCSEKYFAVQNALRMAVLGPSYVMSEAENLSKEARAVGEIQCRLTLDRMQAAFEEHFALGDDCPKEPAAIAEPTGGTGNG